MSIAENKTLFTQMIHKLGLSEHEQLLPKSTELLRLLQSKSTGSNVDLQAYAKVIICIDLAANLLGLPFDNETASKLCGLKKTAYANGKRTLEKILDISKVIGINEMCIQLGLNQVQKEALTMLENYKRYVGGVKAEVDFAHPQYATMAVFQACKKMKVKPPKTKLVAFSHLKPTQWTMLEKNWDNFLAQSNQRSAAAAAKPVKEAAAQLSPEEEVAVMDTRIIGAKHCSPEKIEPYVNWKKRMLEKAYRDLKALQAR
ncbi:origin recognition complex subunit 6 [Aedes aegypti]|uniref:Uncharacterized protein n=1 Tax=Aedes aegypti TaxID=7159 RepID=A0A1S4FQ03_AEDAE|nr:origin recognition complex subunit 6 [Aedes aegypti]